MTRSRISTEDNEQLAGEGYYVLGKRKMRRRRMGKKTRKKRKRGKKSTRNMGRTKGSIGGGRRRG